MRTCRGFTLIELVVVLSIVGALLSLAAPLAASLAGGMRMASVTNLFFGHLQLARSEAIKRNGPVALCSSADQLTCSVDGGWEQGWIVFHDRNNNGRREADEPLVHGVGPVPTGLRVMGNTSVARYVSFAATGGTRTTSGAFQAGTVTVCRESAAEAEARQIVISAVGRPRIRRTPVATCP